MLISKALYLNFQAPVCRPVWRLVKTSLKILSLASHAYAYGLVLPPRRPPFIFHEYGLRLSLESHIPHPRIMIVRITSSISALFK